jgi:CTP synthase
MRMKIVKLEGHPFFFAMQFHPEFKSRPNKPSPPFRAFVDACLEALGGARKTGD